MLLRPSRLAQLTVTLTVALLYSAACSDAGLTGPGGEPIVRLSIWPKDASVHVRDSVEYTAYGFTAVGDTVLVDVEWSVDSGEVKGKGKGKGQYKPRGPGRYKVKATADTLSDSTTVTVSEVRVARVDVTPDNAVLDTSETRQLTATARDSLGNELPGRVMSWSSVHRDVAAVDDMGRVTAMAEGSTTVAASVEGVSGASAIRVTTSAGAVASVEVAPATLALRLGRTFQMSATPRDAAGNPVSGQAVSWSTGDASVATVDATGTVAAVGLGTGTITATSAGQSGTASVTVSQASAGYPNEPGGALPVSAAVPLVHDHANLVGSWPETDAQPFNAVNQVGTASFTVTDPTAPVNPMKVGATYLEKSLVSPPPPHACQNGGCTVGKMRSDVKLAPPSGVTVKEWYCSFHFKVQSINNLEPEIDIFGLKFLNFWGGGPNIATTVLNFYPQNAQTHPQEPWRLAWYAYTHDGTQMVGPYDVWWGYNDATLAGAYAPGGSKFVSGGNIFYSDTWYHIETIIDYMTSRVAIFVDGEVYRDYLLLDVAAPNHSIPGIPRQPEALEWSHVWGGARTGYWSEPAFNPFYLYHDETYCSYTTSP